jgi:hypothetical protein
MHTNWWTTGQTSFAPGGEQIVRVGTEMFIRSGPTERFRALTVTYPENIPTTARPIGILHFEDAVTGRVGTLVAELGKATVCYNHASAVTYPTAIISERTRALLPEPARA